MVEDPTQSQASEAPQWLCPVCGTLTPDAFCPKDRTATVMAQAFTKHPRSYAVDDVVAGRFRITGALGAGGFAAVYASVDVETGDEVAVKLMSFDPAAESARVAVRRFFREAKVMADLRSENTVRVYGVGQDDGGALYIAMEQLHGESLEELLQRRLRARAPLSEQETIDIALPILDSLAEAHAQGLVHRDLKPANVFLCSREDGPPVVKVLDFGIARTADSSLTVGGSIPGTPPFMSPEQCRGETVDGRSDLYSLAVMLYLCATGRLPFHHANALKLMRMHAFDPAPDPREMTSLPLSDGFATVLLRSLAKQPAGRPRDAAELRADLARIREGEWEGDIWDGETGAIQPLSGDSEFEMVRDPSDPPVPKPSSEGPSSSVRVAPSVAPAPAAPAAPAAPVVSAEAPQLGLSRREVGRELLSTEQVDAPVAGPAQGRGGWIGAAIVFALLLGIVGAWFALRGQAEEAAARAASEAAEAAVKQAQAAAEAAKQAAQRNAELAAAAGQRAAQATDPEEQLRHVLEAQRLEPDNAAWGVLVKSARTAAEAARQKAAAATAAAAAAAAAADAGSAEAAPSAAKPETAPSEPRVRRANPSKPATARDKPPELAPALMD